MKLDVTFAESNKNIQADFSNLQTLKGDPGASAYQIAVQNGFEGTETEWLASLKGEPGPPSAGVGTAFETDETLTLKDGILSVNTADDVLKDNTLPITSAAVYAEVGNINALLETI